MKRYQTLMLAAVFGLAAPAAQAQEKLKIGVIATLSGPPAVLGQQLRNGVQLAVKTLGGKFGGRDIVTGNRILQFQPLTTGHLKECLGGGPQASLVRRRYGRRQGSHYEGD